ncbi:MAG: MFS transporter [Sulfobacillus sp.]|nr:MFS transporter [Sulfobacillus sp.]
MNSTVQERWTRADSWSFWAFALGFLLENYIFSMAPIANGWVSNMPKSLTSLLLAWAPLWLIIGIMVAGPVSDRVGRKNTFYLTMALYGIGGLGLIFFSHTYTTLLIFLALLLFASGGEMNTIMVASHEIMPRQHRSKTIMLALNFINLGGVILGALALLTRSFNSSVAFQKATVGVALLIVLIVLLFARVNTPESLRWLIRKGDRERAEAEALKYYGPEEGPVRLRLSEGAHEASAASSRTPPVSMAVRWYTTLTISFAGSAGFGLMTYVLGPYYFKNDSALIVFIATLVGFISGFFGFWADRWSRKMLLLIGYAGTFLSTVVIYFTVGSWAKNLALFWVLLVILNLFTNIGYLTEDTLKGEVWPTRHRGTYTALVRFISIGLYIVTIYITQNFSLTHTMLFNMFIWAIGLSGALVWYVKGHETGRGVSIDQASLE